MSDDQWLERLGAATGGVMPEHAPARLTSKIYSAIVSRMAESGPLLDLADIKRAGGRLCVFENVVTVLPVGPDIRSMNPCRICHARVLGERMDHAPIFWPACPYSEFHSG